MSGKLKLKGHLKHLARWPLYLSVLLIVLNILVYVINIKAGVVVTMGNVLYLVAAITLLFYHRPLMFNDLIAFASQYEFLEKKVLEELALPYAVMDMQGRMIWCNKVFAQLTGKDQFYRKNINTIFPDITPDKLPVPEEKAHGQEHQEVQQALHQHLPVSQLREPHQRIQNGDAPHPVAAEQDDEQRYEVGDAQQHQHPPTDPFFQKQIDDGGTANDGQEQEQGGRDDTQQPGREEQR